MNYTLLRNKIYLTLLAYFNHGAMPSFTTLGKKAGMTRQTASVKVKELQENELIKIEDNILIVNNPLNIDERVLKDYLDNEEGFDPIELYNILFDASGYSRKYIGEKLDMARQTIYNSNHPVVYGIIEDGVLKYVGSSAHYEQRINQHRRARPHLTEDNFIILVDNVGKNPFYIERQLIDILNPEWNEV